MFRTIVLICAICSVAFSLPFTGERIVNGTDAKRGEFPYIVSLRRASTGKHFCGASIIKPNWLLTAAHCVYNILDSNVEVQYNVTEITPNRYYVVDVEEIIKYNFYDHDQLINDIALIKLKEPLKFDKFVQPAKLPIGEVAVEGSAVVVPGWNLNKTCGIIQKHLQKVELKEITLDECKNIYKYIDDKPINGARICAGFPEGEKGHYTDDTGGPAIMNGVQVEVVSWGHVNPCNEASYPGVYTSVSTYMSWIRKITEQKFNKD